MCSYLRDHIAVRRLWYRVSVQYAVLVFSIRWYLSLDGGYRTFGTNSDGSCVHEVLSLSIDSMTPIEDRKMLLSMRLPKGISTHLELALLNMLNCYQIPRSLMGQNRAIYFLSQGPIRGRKMDT